MQKRVHFIGGSTVTVFDKDCYLTQIAGLCSDEGTNWKAAVRDKGSPAMTIAGGIQKITAGNIGHAEKYDEPLFMKGGIEVANISGTVGVIDLWINFKPATT